MILNFGKTVAPVYEKWAKIAKTMQINEDCNMDCATECLNPRNTTHYPFFMDQECLHECGCKWDFESIPEDKMKKWHEEYYEASHRLKGEIHERVHEFKSMVGPAIRDYMNKSAETHEETAAFVRKHAVQDLGCNEKCVESCTNPDTHFLWRLPECLKQCNCDQKLVDLKEVSYNYPALIHHNKQDTKAWSLFKKLM